MMEKIGKGAFGDVFLSQEKVTGLLCVVKKVLKRRIKEQKLEEHLLREIKIQSYLRHKHIASLYCFFSDKDYIYLVV